MEQIAGVQTSEIRLAEEPVSGTAATTPTQAAHNDKFDEILEKLEDPNTPIAEVSRLITVELGKVARQAVRLGTDPQDAWKQKAWDTQVKVLTALSKQCQDTDVLSKKDALNFDGRKFQFVLSEIVAIFKKTLIETGLDDATVNNIMLQYSDAMAEAEQRIRRDVERIDSIQSK